MIRIIIISISLATLTGCALFIPEGEMSMSVSEAILTNNAIRQ